MRIVYCIAATYNSGGMERVLTDKANRLAALGHDVTIVTTDQHGRHPFFPLSDAVKTVDLGIGYEDNNGRSIAVKLLQWPLKQWRHRRRLRRLLCRLRPDVTVSMFDHDAPLIPSINEAGRKILEVHFSRYKRLQYGRRGLWALADRWRSRADLRTARRFDRFVTLTNEDLAYWQGVDGAVAIPNATPFGPAGDPALDACKVLAVGRLSHQKGFDRLLKAWASIARLHPGWKLEIVGSGPLEIQLKTMIDSLSISDSVVMTPSCNNMPEKYASASILAMTSRYEGLPMALIEAQTCRLPIVAMDCRCGPRDVVADGRSGFVTPEGDIDTFAERLSQLMDDSPLRQAMSIQAATDASRFAPEKIIDQWISLFQNS